MRCLFAMIVGVMLTLYAPPNVHAQDAASRAATARAMFEQGLSFVDSGNWSDAADRFRRALALKEDSHVIRYNLASALIELGKLIEASELLRQIVKDGAADGKIKGQAQQKLDETNPRLSALTIQLEGPDEGVVVKLDEQALDPVMLGVAVPSDPGTHQLQSTKGGEIVDEQTVSLAEGESREVTLRTTKVATPLEAAATVATPEAQQSSPPRNDSEGKKSSRWLWWGVGGGAVVATVAVIAVLAATSSSESEKPARSDFDGGAVYVKVNP